MVKNFYKWDLFLGHWSGQGTVLEWLLPPNFRKVVGYEGFPASFSILSLWVGSLGHWASTETPCDSHTSLPPLSQPTVTSHASLLPHPNLPSLNYTQVSHTKDCSLEWTPLAMKHVSTIKTEFPFTNHPNCEIDVKIIYQWRSTS